MFWGREVGNYNNYNNNTTRLSLLILDTNHTAHDKMLKCRYLVDKLLDKLLFMIRYSAGGVPAAGGVSTV